MIRLPKIRGRRRKALPAVPVGRGRSRARYGPTGKPARTRAQLEDRADRLAGQRAPIGQPGARVAADLRPYGARVTPLGDRADRLGGRNYPARGNLRQRKAGREATRGQLAQRRAVRAAAGLPATQPHPKSGEGARSVVRARGVAQRPPSAMPRPQPHGAAPARVAQHHADPQPHSTGRGFAGLFFGDRVGVSR